MRVAVIGSGTAGCEIVRALMECSAVKSIGVVASSEDKWLDCKSLAESAGGEAFGDWQALQLQGKADLVIICTSPELQVRVALEVLQYKVPVVTHGPWALLPEDAKQLIEAYEKDGIGLYTTHSVRYEPHVDNVLQQVGNGRIGRIGVVNGKRAVVNPSESYEWLQKAASLDDSSGIMLALMWPELEMIQSMLDEPVTIYAMHRQAEGTSCVMVTLKYRSGAMVNLEGIWGLPGLDEQYYEWAGKEGTVRHNSHLVPSLRKHTSTATHASLNPHANALSKRLQQVMTSIRTGIAPSATIQESQRALVLARAAIESVETGMAVSLASFANIQTEGGSE